MHTMCAQVFLFPVPPLTLSMGVENLGIRGKNGTVWHGFIMVVGKERKDALPSKLHYQTHEEDNISKKPEIKSK